jgi:thermitase
MRYLILALLAVCLFLMTNALPSEQVPVVNIPLAGTAVVPQDVPAWSKPLRPACDKTVRVAMVDTGIDYNHPDLNRFVDDLVGIDIMSQEHLPYDDRGHGTHIAGIIAKGWTSGTCLRLYAVRYTGSFNSPFTNLEHSTQGLRHLSGKGFDVINYSGGGLDPSDEERAAVKQLVEEGAIFVAAAGNEGSPNPYYPAAYLYDGEISVASTDDKGKLVPSSGFGAWVDVATLGFKVRSAAPGGGYESMTGTSQATALISGMVAQLIAEDMGDITGRRARVLARLRSRCVKLGDLSCGYVAPNVSP